MKQSNELGSWSSVSSTNKLIQMNKRMSEQPHLHKFNGDDILRSIVQNRSEDIMEGHSADASQKRLKTEKEILLQSQKTLKEPREIVE